VKLRINSTTRLDLKLPEGFTKGHGKNQVGGKVPKLPERGRAESLKNREETSRREEDLSGPA